MAPGLRGNGAIFSLAVFFFHTESHERRMATASACKLYFSSDGLRATHTTCSTFSSEKEGSVSSLFCRELSFRMNFRWVPADEGSERTIDIFFFFFLSRLISAALKRRRILFPFQRIIWFSHLLLFFITKLSATYISYSFSVSEKEVVTSLFLFGTRRRRDDWKMRQNGNWVCGGYGIQAILLSSFLFRCDFWVTLSNQFSLLLQFLVSLNFV